MKPPTPTEPIDVRMARAKRSLGLTRNDEATERRADDARRFLNPSSASRAAKDATLKLPRADYDRYARVAKRLGLTVPEVLSQVLAQKSRRA
jgi:hypothetical protein